MFLKTKKKKGKINIAVFINNKLLWLKNQVFPTIPRKRTFPLLWGSCLPQRHQYEVGCKQYLQGLEFGLPIPLTMTVTMNLRAPPPT